jgi:uncharacterized delta-60 repeat protein
MKIRFILHIATVVALVGCMKVSNNPDNQTQFNELKQFGFASGLSGAPSSLAIDPIRNRIYIAGREVRAFDGNPLAQVAALKLNGSLDSGFANPLIKNQWDRFLRLQSDGKIILVSSARSEGDAEIVRLTPNGRVDSSFNFPNFKTVYPQISYVSVTVQPNNSILLGGTFPQGAQIGKFLRRINPDGDVDSRFVAPSAEQLPQPNIVVLKSDGRILVGGASSSPTLPLVQLASDGSIDSSFSVNSSLPVGTSIHAVAVKADGKVLVACTFPSTIFSVVVQLNSDGTLDNRFSLSLARGNWITGMKLLPDGRLLTAERGFANILARYNSDGSVDASFEFPEVGFDYSVTDFEVLGDGNIVVVGPFNRLNSASRKYVTLLTADGKPHSDFYHGQAGFDTTPRALAVQADGKVIAGGEFSQIRGRAIASLARLNTDGTPDDTFNAKLYGGEVSGIRILKNGSILVWGRRLSFQGASGQRRVVLLNANGEINTDFLSTEDPYRDYVSTLDSVLELSDGSILTYGQKPAAQISDELIRLSPEGVILNRYPALPQIAGGSLLRQASDGAIMLGGLININNGGYAARLLKLNTDGSVASEMLFSGTITAIGSMELLADSKILVCGIIQVNGTSRKLVRYLPSGEMDPTFDSSFDGVAGPITLHPSGKILLASWSTNFTSLNMDGSPDLDFVGPRDQRGRVVVDTKGNLFFTTPGDFGGSTVSRVVRTALNGRPN